MAKKTAAKDAPPKKDEILVVALRETPERVIDSIRSRRYPKNWRGKLPTKLAEYWKAKGYVRFASDGLQDNTPKPEKNDGDGDGKSGDDQ